jgi:2-dehydro-3-deoxygluconokinase
MIDCTGFGEILTRFSIPHGERLARAPQLERFTGGAEVNVMAALGACGRRTAMISALPDHALGHFAAHDLHAHQIDSAYVRWHDSGRIGVYYVEPSDAPRGTQVIYDRADSCFTHFAPADLPLDVLDTRLIHTSGITLALGDSVRESTHALIRHAKQHQIAVSLDINFRSRLWSASQAAAVIHPLIAQADILFCKHADGVALFGLDASPHLAIAQLARQLPAHAWVIMTVGSDGVYAHANGELVHQPAISVAIVDRLGAGDALAGGVLHGWFNRDLHSALQHGVALAALALTQRGDMLVTTPREIARVIAGLDSPPTHGAILR